MNAEERQDTIDALQEAIIELVSLAPSGQREEAKALGNEAWGFVEELTADEIAIVDRAEMVTCGCGLNEPCRKCWSQKQ